MKLNKYTKLVDLGKEYCLYNTYNSAAVTLPKHYFNTDLNIDKNLSADEIQILKDFEMLDDSEKEF